jgi:N-acetylglucosamine-6-phosphate deacetylase
MKRALFFKNVDVANDGVVMVNRDVLILGDRIARNDPTPPPLKMPLSYGVPSDVPVVHGPGLLAPGFVDTHIHGRQGFDVMCPGDLEPLSRSLPQQGVTGFLPTMVAAPRDEMKTALREARGHPGGAKVLGIHMEGPFLSPAQPGMFDPVKFCEFDVSLWQELCVASAVPIRLMTVAAERLELRELRELISTGIVLSLGHTDASYRAASEIFAHGVKRVTHAYNAMRGFHHRAPGVVGALLDHGEIDAEIILDGLHIDAPSARILSATRTAGRLVLVSDSVPPVGRSPGVYEWAGRHLQVDDDSLRLESGQLAGSTGTMDAAMRRAVEWLEVSVAKAVQMATTNARRSVGLAPQEVRVGDPADLVLMDSELKPSMTIIDGVICWRRDEP